MSALASWNSVPVLVVGAGIMGSGIAQVAAQAGHAVFLFDLRDGASVMAKEQLTATLKILVSKGKMSKQQAEVTLSRISPVSSLTEASSALLVVEAIVEQLDAKQTLFRQLEGVLPSNAILATNTSSISVTAIAKGLQHPERVVGMHFFNPVPLMRLVEVVHGLQTADHVAEAIYELSKNWGKVPVHAKSTPGFIVNRIARPYYAETMGILQEQGAKPHELDACLSTVGFKMGPCALMDLIGHDTNFAVTNSVYAANFFDKRFVPSIVQRELVDGGLLGRKTGQGFYNYIGADPGPPRLEVAPSSSTLEQGELVVHGSSAHADWIAASLSGREGVRLHRDPTTEWTGIASGGFVLQMTDGRTASELGTVLRSEQVAVFDRFDPVRLHETKSPMPLAFAVPQGCEAAVAQRARDWLSALGFNPLQMKDLPGLVVARTLAMLINEAADAVFQGVCEQEAADAAMKLGVNYPRGPFEWLAEWSAKPQSCATGVVAVLDSLDAYYRGERYRVSPWLRARSLRAINSSSGALQ